MVGKLKTYLEIFCEVPKISTASGRPQGLIRHWRKLGSTSTNSASVTDKQTDRRTNTATYSIRRAMHMRRATKIQCASAKIRPVYGTHPVLCVENSPRMR